MSAVQTLAYLREHGVSIGLDGDDLLLSDAEWLPQEAIDRLRELKHEILALLRPTEDGWSGEDWRAFFDERAGIAEFDGGLPRSDAEARAFASCVVAWLNRNPDHSSSERCLGCGGGERPGDTLLPFGVESTGHAWLHSRCWPDWYARRKTEAVAALAAMGIALPAASTVSRHCNPSCTAAGPHCSWQPKCHRSPSCLRGSHPGRLNTHELSS
jgi:hypothetical protein